MKNVVWLAPVFFVVDVAFDSVLKTGSLSSDYVLGNAWVNTSLAAITMYLLCIVLLAGGAAFFGKRWCGSRHASRAWFVSLFLGVGVLLPIRYALHVFVTLY